MLDSLEIVVLMEDSVPMDGELVAEHGLSFLVRGTKNGRGVCGLLDVGQTPDLLARNMRELGICPGEIEFVVLSHCHYDHTGGLAALVASVGRRELPVIAHPEVFRPHFKMAPAVLPLGVRPDDRREAVEAVGGVFLLSDVPFPIAAGLTTTGEIPRVTDFEGKARGFYTLCDGAPVPDPMMDDMGMIARVKGRGMVLLSGCSHSGVINMLKRARSLYPDDPVVGVIGGLHLVNASDEAMDGTIEGLREFDPEWIACGHCTGFPMQARLLGEFGDRFTPLSVGQRYVVES
ncbi:MAG: MBL fold metallo-hydrolase [Synergistaceae bacterium]|nr:MBL fold metallo-hydrolase [Synergistota bacterium]NLM71795.1 MBL fold metallo-hydrolase [Synergistaceae bacterium]